MLTKYHFLKKLSMVPSQDLFWFFQLKRFFTTIPVERIYQQTFDSFNSMIKHEKADAKNHILIEDNTNKFDLIGAKDLENLLKSSISSLVKYSVNRRNFFFVKLNDYKSFRNNNLWNFNELGITPRSRIFRLPNIPLKNLTSERNCKVTKRTTLDTIFQDLGKVNNSSDFTNLIRQNILLTSFETKLRFFLLVQLEELLCTGIFSRLELFPFGSTVNGFGINTSDLDLCLLHKSNILNDSRSCLIFQENNNFNDERMEAKRCLECISNIMKNFVPGVSEVTSILTARVPIIKFYSDLTNINSDLSYNSDKNVAGIVIAEILYKCSCFDEKVVDLMTFIKLWAKRQGLTNSMPGFWLTNFGLMMLVIHFLQCRKPPILPSLKYFGLNNSKKENRNFNKTKNISFHSLLKEFFEYIYSFDFSEYGFNLVDAKVIRKPNYDSIYIENPLERHLNVCKNVNAYEVNRLTKLSYLSWLNLNQNVPLVNLFQPFIKSNKSEKIKVKDLIE